MKARWMALAALCALCVTSGAAAQQEGGSFDEAMQEWMKYMMPGDPHKDLEFYAGHWKFVNHVTMEGQDMTTEGTAHAEMMLGGRYLHQVTDGEMMGMPFQGVGVTGYDNVEKRYFNVWFDNMGTGLMVSDGQKKADGSIVFNGSMTDPMRGEVKHRMIQRKTGPDSFVFEMYMVQPEGDERVMEITYTRVKS